MSLLKETDSFLVEIYEAGYSLIEDEVFSNNNSFFYQVNQRFSI